MVKKVCDCEGACYCYGIACTVVTLSLLIVGFVYSGLADTQSNVVNSIV